ncbi:hypothetical protein Bca4012_092828 [Brassica carinata]
MMKVSDSSSPTGVLEEFFRTEEFESSQTTTTNKNPSSSSSRFSRVVHLLRSTSKKSLENLKVPFQYNNSVTSSLRRCSSLRDSLRFGSSNDSPVLAHSPRRIFSFSDLKTATNNFAPENLIGKGGYAEVYKGKFSNGQMVAIKRLMRGNSEEIIIDFLSEMGIMAHVNHPNIAKLLGYGVEGGMHLVLELLKGEDEMEHQICDFGLAKWLPEHWTHHIVSKFEGTFGYLAPEYLTHGIVDEKTDVFALGVLLLELVTGRRALDYSKQSLVLWAKPLMKKNKIRELIDPSLAGEYEWTQIKLVVLAASLSIQESSLERPGMSQVVEILKGNLNDLKCITKCRVPFYRKAFRDENMSRNIEKIRS